MAEKDPSFHIAEYNAKWAYLQHTEEMSQKLFHLFIGVVGALLAFSLTYSERQNWDILTSVELRFVEAFIVIYATFLYVLLDLRNHNYGLYAKRIREIEEIHGGALPQERTRKMKVSGLYEFFPVLIGASALVLFVYNFLNDMPYAGWCAIIVAYAYLTLMMFFPRILEKIIR